MNENEKRNEMVSRDVFRKFQRGFWVHVRAFFRFRFWFRIFKIALEIWNFFNPKFSHNHPLINYTHGPWTSMFLLSLIESPGKEVVPARIKCFPPV